MSEAHNPIFHANIVTVRWSPVIVLVAVRASFKNYKAWEAANVVAVGRNPVLRPIDLHELDLVTVLSREFIYDFVPFGHEFDAVSAVWHEKVYYDKLFGTSCLNEVLILVSVVGLCSLCLFPPILSHSVYLYK